MVYVHGSAVLWFFTANVYNIFQGWMQDFWKGEGVSILGLQAETGGDSNIQPNVKKPTLWAKGGACTFHDVCMTSDRVCQMHIQCYGRVNQIKWYSAVIMYNSSPKIVLYLVQFLFTPEKSNFCNRYIIGIRYFACQFFSEGCMYVKPFPKRSTFSHAPLKILFNFPTTRTRGRS